MLTQAVHHSATRAAALLLELAEATDQLEACMKQLNEFQQFPEQRDLLVLLARADMIGPEQITDAEVKAALEAALGRKGAQHLPATGQ